MKIKFTITAALTALLLSPAAGGQSLDALQKGFKEIPDSVRQLPIGIG